MGRGSGRVLGVRGGHSAAAAPGAGLLQKAQRLAETGPAIHRTESCHSRHDTTSTAASRGQFATHAAFAQRLTPVRRAPDR